MARPRKWFPKEKICEYCGETFQAKTSYAIYRQRFCNLRCRSKFVGEAKKAKRLQRKCKKCGKTISIVPSLEKTKFFCSYSCSSSFRYKGSGNPAWTGGDAKYWKLKARERDNFTCQFPGCKKRGKGNQVHAHHKIPRSVGGSDDLDNLITLCPKHHREVERRTFVDLVKMHPESTRKISVTIFGRLGTA